MLQELHAKKVKQEELTKQQTQQMIMENTYKKIKREASKYHATRQSEIQTDSDCEENIVASADDSENDEDWKPTKGISDRTKRMKKSKV